MPTTHRRLEQAHRLWHQCLDDYHDPDAFLTNLNAAVQTFRSVTFMLQSEKASVPLFDEWYDLRQSELRADHVMKWLSGARTEVVHKTDLTLASRAHATIHNNLTHLSIGNDVDPSLPTEVLAHALSATIPEPFAQNRDHLVLSLERDWKVPGLDVELLESLAHAYSVLRAVVDEAHKMSGSDCPPEVEPPGNDGMLPCMRTTRTARTVRVSLADGAQIVARTGRIHASPRWAEIAVHRYGLIRAGSGKEPRQLAEFMLEQAKRILVVDGFHMRFFHLVTPDGMRLVLGEAVDRPTKYALLRHVAEEVRRHSATAVIETAEAWMAPIEKMGTDFNAATSPGRIEVLVVTLVANDGTVVQHTTPFRRGPDGSILLDKTVTTSEKWPDYLSPIAEVWNVKPDSGASKTRLNDA